MADDLTLKRELPHSDEAEGSVIGSMFIDKDAVLVASETLSKDDFYNPVYQTLYDAMIEVYHEGKAVEPITVQDKLKAKKAPEEISGLEFLKDTYRMVTTSANIKNYADIVREKSILRELIRANEKSAKECYEGVEDLDTICEDAEKNIFKVLQRRDVGEYSPIRDVVLSSLAAIEKASKDDSPITGIPTGFTDLDYRLSGLQPSDLVLIAARPSMGKTAFVLNIAEYMALKGKKNVAIFSLEMSKEQLVNRLFALNSHINSQKIRTGKLSDIEWEQLIETSTEIGNSHMIIDDTPGITISELRRKCRKYKLEQGLDVIIIDYLQLMQGSAGKRSENRQQEISDISRSLKALARELHVPVVALSQLSRGVEARENKRPMLSDLRESGAIEQDADVVMFIYRDAYYNKDSEKGNVAEIIVAKQRNGPTGTSELLWLPDYTKFANKEKEYSGE
ncbi:MAG: replicative DNA helicase [Lachnospiraceae bacterium]|jgi:replicative DNA helicase|nr:replicative DNA helicase [Lachnospiraceae bacterium]